MRRRLSIKAIQEQVTLWTRCENYWRRHGETMYAEGCRRNKVIYLEMMDF